MKGKNRYESLLDAVFFAHFRRGFTEFDFEREELQEHASRLGIKLPKNLGDLIYSFRYRIPLPKTILATAPKGMEWSIHAAGRSRYRFSLTEAAVQIAPNAMLVDTKIPDATPGIIAMYALSDEQSLLAKLRYNRLVDIFMRVTCYSLQSHLRTFVSGMGQVETDEIYVGVDRRGAHLVFPVQAKGGKDRLSTVQIRQDTAMCRQKFGSLICRPIGAQFVGDDLIALFEFEECNGVMRISTEKHYRLVAPEALTSEDLATYGMSDFDVE